MYFTELQHSDEFDDAVMVALLPTTSYWSKLKLPHLTLVHAGKITDNSPGTANELAKVASDLSVMNRRIQLNVMEKAIFGETERVDVLKLRPTPALNAMRRALEGWNKSEYETFEPHVTLGPAGSMYHEQPGNIEFDKIIVAWGKNHLVFSMN